MQDRVLMLPGAAVVLDGASGDGGGRDGGWYSAQLAAALRDELGDGPRGDLRAHLRNAIERLRHHHDLRPGASPSSTVAILRWSDDTADALVLGDATMVALQQDGHLTRLHDRRLEHVAVAERHAYRSRLARGGGYDARHRGLLRDLTHAEREHRNRPGGYWIAEALPDAADHALTASWRLAELDTVLLATDGAANGVDRYGTPPTWHDAIDVVRTAGPARLLDGIHQVEESDPHGSRWPRSKRHDDKAAVLLTFA